MSITEYKTTSELLDFVEVNIGKLYFFEDYFITEFNEGVHIDSNSFEESRQLIQDFYKDRNFGVITNRINTYSIDLNDADYFNNSFPKLKAYAVVCNTLFGKGVFEIENQFFTYNRKIFKELEEAILWVKNILS